MLKTEKSHSIGALEASGRKRIAKPFVSGSMEAAGSHGQDCQYFDLLNEERIA